MLFNVNVVQLLLLLFYYYYYMINILLLFYYYYCFIIIIILLSLLHNLLLQHTDLFASAFPLLSHAPLLTIITSGHRKGGQWERHNWRETVREVIVPSPSPISSLPSGSSSIFISLPQIIRAATQPISQPPILIRRLSWERCSQIGLGGGSHVSTGVECDKPRQDGGGYGRGLCQG